MPDGGARLLCMTADKRLGACEGTFGSCTSCTAFG
jgi:hypothetical protein